jgi:hypothetical protein
MPDKPERTPDKSTVIMEHMEDTRKDLADKLEQLEKKVTDTVGSVTDLVEKVPETVETVKETIEETVQTVTGTVHQTLGAVKHGVAETVETVKSFFDIPYQVNRHPWLMLGGSVLLGYLGGRLLLPRRRAERLAADMTSEMSAASAYTPAYSPAAPSSGTSDWSGASPPASSYGWQGTHETEARSSGPSWVSRLTEHFGGEIHKVKELALGALMGAVRDVVTRWVPETLRHDVTEVINNFTSDLGGKVFHEPVLGQQQDNSPQASYQPPQQPGEGQQAAESQETWEPAASASRGTTSRRGGHGKR